MQQIVTGRLAYSYTPSITALQIGYDYPSRGGAAYDSSKSLNVFTIMAGTNDKTQSTANTDLAVFRNLRSTFRQARATGYQRRLVGTLISRNDGTAGDNRSFDSNTMQLSTLLRTHFNNTAELDADGLFDFAANAAFDQATDASSANYSGDFLHPSDAGYSIMGGILGPKLTTAITGPGTRIAPTPIWSPLDTSPSMLTTNSGRTISYATGSGDFAQASAKGWIGKNAGKWTWETVIDNAHLTCVGIMTEPFEHNIWDNFNSPQSDPYSIAWGWGTDQLTYNGSNVLNLGALADGDIVQHAVDADARLYWVRRNGGQWNGSSSANPATGVGGVDITAIGTGPIYPVGYGDGNFIMTDPKTQKTIIYNQPNWSPFNKGDWASLIPEAGETIGGVLGGAAGAAAGGPTVIGNIGLGAVGAGLGAATGREAAQSTANYLFGNDDTRTPLQHVEDAGKTALINGAGEVGGQLIGRGASALYKGLKSGVVGTADDAAHSAARAIDLRDIGAEPTAGMVAGNPSTAVKEQALASTSAGKPIQDRISQAFDAQGNLFDRTVDGLTPQTASRQELGDALKAQAQAAKDASAARSDELYGRVGTLAGDAPASGTNVKAFLDRLAAERQGLGASASLNKAPAFDQALAQTRAIHSDIAGGNATFNTLKDARTSIGALANDPSTDKVLAGHANDLYTALTADMADTASGVGDDALTAWKKANNRFRRSMQPGSVFNSKTALDPIINAKTPEQAADWVMGQANKGGTRLQAVRRQVENSDGGRDVWSQLTGSVVERMGKSAPDADFNPMQMAKQWNAMAPEAKDALFAGTDRVAYRQNMDRIARVAENLKNYRRMDNHSNTAKFGENLKTSNIISNATVLGVLFHNPVAGGAMIAGKVGDVVANKAYRAMQVKMLTSPETVNWLAGASAASMRPGGFAAHMAKLGSIAANTTDQGLATAINDYRRELRYDK